MLYTTYPQATLFTTPSSFTNPNSTHGNWIPPSCHPNENGNTIYVGMENLSPYKRSRVLLPCLQENDHGDVYLGKRRRLNPDVMPKTSMWKYDTNHDSHNKRSREGGHDCTNNNDALFGKRRRLDPNLLDASHEELESNGDFREGVPHSDETMIPSSKGTPSSSCRALVPVRQFHPVIDVSQASSTAIMSPSTNIPPFLSPCRAMVVWKPQPDADATMDETSQHYLDVEERNDDDNDAQMDMAT